MKTNTDLAAALIAGVPRYEQTGRGMNPDRNGAYFAVDEVLTALTAALDGVDERAGKVEKLRGAAKALIDVLDAEDEEGDFLIEAHGSKSILMRYAAAKKAVRAALTDAAQAREAVWREVAELVRGWRNDVPMTGEECANAILALIGEERK